MENEGEDETRISMENDEEEDRTNIVTLFDDATQHYYYYNQVTGDSQWVEDNGFSFQSSPTNSSNFRRVSQTHDVTTAEMESDSRSATGNVFTEQTSDKDVILFSRLVFVHICCIEAPLAVLECLLRFGTLLLVAIISVIVGKSYQSKWWMKFSFHCARESVIAIAAGATLTIPFAVCYAYRSYFSSLLIEEWVLSPIPTLVGAVDARRFATFVYGYGAVGSNNLRILRNSMDSGNDSNSHLLGKSDKVELFQNDGTILGAIKEHGDSWSGGIYFAPEYLLYLLFAEDDADA